MSAAGVCRLLEGPSRRRFLQFGVVGVALLAVVGVAGVDLSRRGEVSGAGVLGARERRALAAIAARICPGRPGVPGADEIGLVDNVDAFLACGDPQVVSDLSGLLRVFASRWGGLLLDGRFRAFTDLSGDEQDQVLTAWRTSGLALKRGAFSAIRGLLMARYWSDPRVYGASGYPGPPNYGQRSAP